MSERQLPLEKVLSDVQIRLFTLESLLHHLFCLSVCARAGDSRYQIESILADTKEFVEKHSIERMHVFEIGPIEGMSRVESGEEEKVIQAVLASQEEAFDEINKSLESDFGDWERLRKKRIVGTH